MNTSYYTTFRFGQTVDHYSNGVYGGSVYSCNGNADCIKNQQTSTTAPSAPDTGSGFFPALSSASPMVLIPVGLALAVVVAGIILFAKKTIRKRQSQNN